MLLRGKRRENLNILSVIKTVTKQPRGKYWRKKMEIVYKQWLFFVSDYSKRYQ